MELVWQGGTAAAGGAEVDEAQEVRAPVASGGGRGSLGLNVVLRLLGHRPRLQWAQDSAGAPFTTEPIGLTRRAEGSHALPLRLVVQAKQASGARPGGNFRALRIGTLASSATAERPIATCYDSWLTDPDYIEAQSGSTKDG